jgi:flagellar biosynthetic protein FliQ
MDLTLALDLSREALLTALLISGPVLIAGLIVGLLISIMPKIVAMVAAAIFFVPWLAERVLEYSQNMFAGR